MTEKNYGLSMMAFESTYFQTLSTELRKSLLTKELETLFFCPLLRMSTIEAKEPNIFFASRHILGISAFVYLFR